MQVVFFDLETSGLGSSAEVLQIAARSPDANYDFEAYIMPTRPIPSGATRINGLTSDGSRLYYRGSPVTTESRRDALWRLYDFLSDIGNDCTMVAHNCSFDSYYLLKIIKKEGLLEAFGQVIDGFTDTLVMLQDIYPERKYQKGQLTLKTLAEDIGLSTEGIHDASQDAWLLQKIAFHYFSEQELIENRMSFGDALQIRR